MIETKADHFAIPTLVFPTSVNDLHFQSQGIKRDWNLNAWVWFVGLHGCFFLLPQGRTVIKSNKMPSQDKTILVDGTMDFSGGVDSYRVTTAQSGFNLNGLPKNTLSWLVNGTTRGGVIEPRAGQKFLSTLMADPGLYQGGFMYEPQFGLNPYLVFLMDGTLYAVQNLDVELTIPGSIKLVDLTGGDPTLQMPATQPHAYFCQGEEFLIIQSGDGSTLPLFWDGATLRRSKGLNPVAGVTRELPAAYAMTYYMNRIWYVYGDQRTYTAGDIVGNTASGTNVYRYHDAILKVTENPLAIGGDGFSVPSNSGTIRWLGYAATNNTLLGQGVLMIGTRKQIYGLQVPVTRADWIGANSSNMPLQYCVSLSTGPVNDRSVVRVNSDVFFQTLQPSVQSLTMAVRNDQAWGDTPISVNEERILQFNDRGLLNYASGIYFDNRMLQTAIPTQTTYGVIHQSILPLNFDSISTIGKKSPPVWEGQYAGLDHFQLFTGDFGGMDRDFSLVLSRVDGSFQIWELTKTDHRDYGDNRITSVMEFPAFTWNLEFDLKELLTAEMWLDGVRGTVDLLMEYRPDSDSCWYPWHKWKVCAARNSEEALGPKTPYTTQYGPGYHSTLTLPHPPSNCNSFTGRPAYIAYQIQCRLTITGWCRVRGLMLHASLRQRELYAGKVCPATPQALPYNVLTGAGGDPLLGAGGEPVEPVSW